LPALPRARGAGPISPTIQDSLILQSRTLTRDTLVGRSADAARKSACATMESGRWRWRGVLTLLQQLVQGERDLVRMGCTPGDDPLELDQIVGDGTDLHQVGFDCLRIAHSSFSIAHPGAGIGLDKM